MDWDEFANVLDEATRLRSRAIASAEPGSLGQMSFLEFWVAHVGFQRGYELAMSATQKTQVIQ